jgi:chromosome segregation ATPase
MRGQITGHDFYADLNTEKHQLMSISSQTQRIKEFSEEYNRRMALIEALEQENRLLRGRLKTVGVDSGSIVGELEERVSETEYRLEECREELALEMAELCKYKEFAKELEMNNEYFKLKSKDHANKLLELEIFNEMLFAKLQGLERDVAEVAGQIDLIGVSVHETKSVSSAVNKKADSFEDLAGEVRVLRKRKEEMERRVAEAESRIESVDGSAKKLQARDHLLLEEKLRQVETLRKELQALQGITRSQEDLSESLQVDAETLREENAYLAERLSVKVMAPVKFD